MKLACALCVLSVLFAGYTQAVQQKRQLDTILNLALPFLEKFLSGNAIQNLIGTLVSDITGFFQSKSGDTQVPGTQLSLHYNIHKCTFHVGRKRIIFKGFGEQCKADVCENKLTHSCRSCTKGHQADALKCAMDLEVQYLTQLAKQAAAQTTPSG